MGSSSALTHRIKKRLTGNKSGSLSSVLRNRPTTVMQAAVVWGGGKMQIVFLLHFFHFIRHVSLAPAGRYDIIRALRIMSQSSPMESYGVRKTFPSRYLGNGAS
jgi:hypothetical protein